MPHTDRDWTAGLEAGKNTLLITLASWVYTAGIPTDTCAGSERRGGGRQAGRQKEKAAGQQFDLATVQGVGTPWQSWEIPSS
jgi:hypothetical protein